MKKKILIIGFGSIGKKHFQIVNKYKKNFSAIVSSSFLGKKIFKTKKNQFFAGIIASPSRNHLKDLKMLIKSETPALVEKPLYFKSLSLKEEKQLLQTIKKNKILIQTAYCLRFHPAIVFLKRFIEKNKKEKILNIQFLTNSFLPLWRTGDYRKHVSGSKKLGGGVLNELSHEIDLIIYLFGLPKPIISRISNSNNLDINVEDNADIIFKTNFSSNIHMHLDFYSLPERREINIIFKSKKIRVDLINNKVEITEKNKKKIKNFKTEKDYIYIKQFENFINNINNKKLDINSFKNSIDVLKIIHQIKRSNKTL